MRCEEPCAVSHSELLGISCRPKRLAPQRVLCVLRPSFMPHSIFENDLYFYLISIRYKHNIFLRSVCSAPLGTQGLPSELRRLSVPSSYSSWLIEKLTCGFEFSFQATKSIKDIKKLQRGCRKIFAAKSSFGCSLLSALWVLKPKSSRRG